MLSITKTRQISSNLIQQLKDSEKERKAAEKQLYILQHQMETIHILQEKSENIKGEFDKEERKDQVVESYWDWIYKRWV